jgi:hypothetical protein
VITRYLYDNEDILFEINGNNNIIAAYVHGPGIDEPIAMTNGQSYYYHTDALGSITAITDSNGNVVQQYEYDDSVGKPLFETNLYLYTANDPVNQVDPLGLFSAEAGRYTVGGGIMVYYWGQMVKKNWKGADPYYHCLASCKAAKTVGPDVSFNLGLFREASDLARGGRWSDSKNDLKSNMQGITCPPKQSCIDRCRPLAPKGMPIP